MRGPCCWGPTTADGGPGPPRSSHPPRYRSGFADQPGAAALHLKAYNAAFAAFEAKGDLKGAPEQPTEWSVEYYDKLQNTVGGGIAKMRWHFGQDLPQARDAAPDNTWPSTKEGPAPASEEAKTELVEALQARKVKAYKDFIGSGEVDPRLGVLRMFREAKEAGLKVAVCSASNKESVIHVLTNLLGEEIFEFLDLFMAGDDVANKKPDPEIYNTAAERLGLTKDECIVVEDSGVGNMAAVRAGMRCVITYTDSTEDYDFQAERIVSNFEGGNGLPPTTIQDFIEGPPAEVVDDRKATVAA